MQNDRSKLIMLETVLMMMTTVVIMITSTMSNDDEDDADDDEADDDDDDGDDGDGDVSGDGGGDGDDDDDDHDNGTRLFMTVPIQFAEKDRTNSLAAHPTNKDGKISNGSTSRPKRASLSEMLPRQTQILPRTKSHQDKHYSNASHKSSLILESSKKDLLEVFLCGVRRAIFADFSFTFGITSMTHGTKSDVEDAAPSFCGRSRKTIGQETAFCARVNLGMVSLSPASISCLYSVGIFELVASVSRACKTRKASVPCLLAGFKAIWTFSVCLS